MKITKESCILAAIGLADLVTTIIFIQHHGAQEANPLFRHYWEMGLAAFVAAKFLCLFGPLVVLEWARQRNPRFVMGALRCTIAAYLTLYSIGFTKLNSSQAHAEELHPVSTVQHIPFARERLIYDMKKGHFHSELARMLILEIAFAPSRRHMSRIPTLGPSPTPSLLNPWDHRRRKD